MPHGAPAGGPAGDRRALLVINPRARRAAAARDPAVLRALAAAYTVEVAVPDSPAALADNVRRAADDGAAAVIAAGGDGTARLAAEALAGTACALGILPAGTANDAGRALGIPAEVRAAAHHLAAARPRPVDLVEATAGNESAADRVAACWLTVGGLGVVTAAALGATALRSGARPARALAALAGPGLYRLSAALALCSPAARVRRYALRYVTPSGTSEEAEIDAHGAFVANLACCGGGLRVPGAGADDDGVFELCFVAPAARPALAARFARLAAGAAVPPAAVRIIAAREAHVRCDAPDALLGDGELLARGRGFHLRARPGAVRVLA